MLCGRRQELLEKLGQKIEDDHGSVLAVQADVGVQSDVIRLVETALERFGRIDVLINNAAVFEPGHAAEPP